MRLLTAMQRCAACLATTYNEVENITLNYRPSMHRNVLHVLNLESNLMAALTAEMHALMFGSGIRPPASLYDVAQFEHRRLPLIMAQIEAIERLQQQRAALRPRIPTSAPAA
jgi:hypothetical protein